MGSTELSNISIAACAVVAVVFGCMVASSGADDRNLLDGWRAKPNVLVILGSGASMASDGSTSSLQFPAGDDDDGRYAAFMERVYGADVLSQSVGPNFREVLGRGSKMHQVKGALLQLMDRGSAYNLGFSYFETQVSGPVYLNFIYTVGEDQMEMLDGSLPGDPLLMGKAVEGRIEEAAFYPVRYGENGEEIFVAKSDPFGTNRGSDAVPRDGDLRLVSFLVDGAGASAMRPWAEISIDERRRRRLFFFPSFDFDELPPQGWIRQGLLGLRRWQDVAVKLGFEITDDMWREDLRRRVVTEIQSHPIGGRTLSVYERYEVFRTGRGWYVAAPSDCRLCAPSRITEVVYSQYCISGPDGLPASSSERVPDMDPRSGCAGFVNADDGLSPIIGLGIPDWATGETKDSRSIIRNFLGASSAPFFFFPTRGESLTLPFAPDNSIPLTQTVRAIGSRSLAESLREAGNYFRWTVANWDDPLGECRSSFIIVITDGGETCEDPRALCSAASELSEVPVYVINLGADAGPSSLECITSRTGGRMYEVDNGVQVGASLEDILQDVEQRSRSFSSLLVSPLGASETQSAFFATFTPVAGRSIWEGHLSAFSVEHLTELFENDGLGSVVPLWDAADALAARWDWGDVVAPSPFGTSVDPRSIYFGAEGSGGDRRRLFAFPGNGAGAFPRRKELGRLIFGLWPERIESESADDRTGLSNTVNFIRGVAVGSDGGGGSVTLRDPDLYGWCGAVPFGGGRTCEAGEQPLGLEKLGDIFHSRPQQMTYPSCHGCFRTDLHGYRQFFSRHRHRRSVLFVGADDGAMHAFDAGIWKKGSGTEGRSGYDAGSGRELFAWVPRSVMNTFPRLAGGSNHRWTVDGTPTIADVWIDPDISESSFVNNRQWRTLLLWGQRRGGRSYVCLDVTEPDPLDENGEVRPSGTPSSSVPAPSILREAGCRTIQGISGCSRPWPQFQWEFTDDSDEDHNGRPDLGLTWSRPVVAFVRVNREGAIEDRMVAFFGGGLSEISPSGGPGAVSGNYIYGLDVETGRILFKEGVDGMVPGDVQLLDMDSDGFVEKLLFGTTAGKVYRVELEEPGVLDRGTGRVGSWRPKVIFSAGPDRPFFMRPTLVPAFVDPEGDAHLAVLIGSGNRDDLIENGGISQRFYVFLESEGGGLTERDLVAIDPGAAAAGIPLLGSEGQGWFLELGQSRKDPTGEKVVTPALVFQSRIVFSTFSLGGGGGGGEVCSSAGTSKTYVVSLMNGDPLPGRARFEEHQAPTVLAGDAKLVIDGDGSIRVFQVSDDLQLREPVTPAPVTVGLVDWREE